MDASLNLEGGIHFVFTEDEYGNTPALRAELDWLLYNKPLEYAQLVLNGEIEHHLSLGCDHGRLEDCPLLSQTAKYLPADICFDSAGRYSFIFIRLRPVHPAVAGGQLADLLLELFGQLGLFQPPAPVLAHGGGLVDAGGVVQPQPVLHGNDTGRCRTA